MDDVTRRLRELKKKKPIEFAKLIAELPPEDAEKLLYDSDIWLRDNQIFDDYKESIILFSGGRGTGKSLSGASWIKKMVEFYGVKRIALVAPTQAECRDIMVEGPSGILSVFAPKERKQVEYMPSKAQVIFQKYGAIAKMYSAEDPDSIRGGNNEIAWGDELSSWKYDDAFDQLMLTLRIGRSQALFTTTPKPTKMMKKLYKRAESGEGVRLITGSTYENLANLSSTFKEQVISSYEGSRLGKQELDGLLLTDIEGALWSNQDIVDCTLDGPPPEDFKRVVVTVDPSGGGGDECGIAVVALGFDDIIYVLKDYTEKLHPSQWAKKVIEVYRAYEADGIVYESNYGGKMVESTLEAVQSNLPLLPVNAKKGKLLRAEPVATLYQRGKVKHVQGLTKLEDEMTTYDGSGKSPNRLDAMVYGVLELMGGRKNFTQVSRFII